MEAKSASSEGEPKRFPLERGRTMEMQFRDVVYAKEQEQKWSLKYNTMTNYEVSKSEFEAYDREYPGFRKGLIWYYEKETRLLVRLTGEMEELLNSWKASGSEEEKKEVPYRVELTFPEKLMKKMEVQLAPNVSKERSEIRKILKDCRGIGRLEELRSPVQPSEYAGTVLFRFKNSWCRNCEKRKVEGGNTKWQNS